MQAGNGGTREGKAGRLRQDFLQEGSGDGCGIGGQQEEFVMRYSDTRDF